MVPGMLYAPEKTGLDSSRTVRRLFPVLRDEGIVSGTTTQIGINYPGCDPLLLSRFLDEENLSAIEYAAEMWGVLEACRRLRTGRVPWVGQVAATTTR